MPTYVIDTPAGDLPRPTTQTTILELIKWLKHYDEIKNIIFVSNQPFVKYQESIISSVFKIHDASINVEVVGPEVLFTEREVQPIIEALGSYIWVQTPTALLKLG